MAVIASAFPLVGTVDVEREHEPGVTQGHADVVGDFVKRFPDVPAQYIEVIGSYLGHDDSAVVLEVFIFPNSSSGDRHACSRSRPPRVRRPHNRSPRANPDHSINTNFRWLGPDDKIVVERYDDHKVANVSCYMSRAETGGIKGAVGIAEDPSRFSIACRAVGPIDLPPRLPKSEVIGFASASLFFKTFQIHRSVDAEKSVLVYTVVSTKLINGSPFNSISVVPFGLR